MRSAAITAAAFLLTACIPYHLHDAAPVAGRVISGATGTPIAGATVALTAASKTGGRSVHTVTDLDGHFSLPAIEHWIIAPLSEGYADRRGTLRVEASGYRGYSEKRAAIPETVLVQLTPET